MRDSRALTLRLATRAPSLPAPVDEPELLLTDLLLHGEQGTSPSRLVRALRFFLLAFVWASFRPRPPARRSNRPPPTTFAPHLAFARHSPPSRLASVVRPSPKASPTGASEQHAGRPTARAFSLARKREPLLLNARRTTACTIHEVPEVLFPRTVPP